MERDTKTQMIILRETKATKGLKNALNKLAIEKGIKLNKLANSILWDYCKKN